MGHQDMNKKEKGIRSFKVNRDSKKEEKTQKTQTIIYTL